MNNRYIDVSKVATGTQIIYVSIPFKYLSDPQPITIKGISNSVTGPTIVINVTDIPDGNQNISTQVQLNYIDGTNSLPNSEGHTEPNHVLWNLGTDGKTFNFGSGRFMGSILAPNATINAGVNVDGNIVANVVNITGGESHRWDIHPTVQRPVQPQEARLDLQRAGLLAVQPVQRLARPLVARPVRLLASYHKPVIPLTTASLPL